MPPRHSQAGTWKLHPLLTQPLFRDLGLGLVSHPFAQSVPSRAGEAELRFMVPGNVDVSGQISRNDGVNVPGSVSTKPAGGVRQPKAREEWVCSICLPVEGVVYPCRYQFNLFAKLQARNGPNQKRQP